MNICPVLLDITIRCSTLLFIPWGANYFGTNIQKLKVYTFSAKDHSLHCYPPPNTNWGGYFLELSVSKTTDSLFTCSQSQNDDITKPCLGLMANLCRHNQSVQVQIKSQVGHALSICTPPPYFHA